MRSTNSRRALLLRSTRRHCKTRTHSTTPYICVFFFTAPHPAARGQATGACRFPVPREPQLAVVDRWWWRTGKREREGRRGWRKGPSQHPGSTLWRRLVARLALVLAPHHVVEANKQHGQTQNDATRQSVQESACVLALVHKREQQHVHTTVTTEAVSPSPTTAHGHTSPQPTRDNKSSSVSRAQRAAHEPWLKQRGSTTPGVTTRKKNGVRFFHARSRHTGHHCLQARSRALATPTPRFRH